MDHWIEPQPLGEAQRNGSAQPPVSYPMQAHSVRRGPLASHSPPAYHSSSWGLGTFGLLGVGLGLLSFVSYFYGRRHGSASAWDEVERRAGKKGLKEVLGNPGDDEDYDEDEDCDEDEE